ncbi:hypothetical protein BLOT_011473 [Blomia tropicalis]|nr:hypothetical protein BLOT_011473 [Blomia tropicalis]
MEFAHLITLIISCTLFASTNIYFPNCLRSKRRLSGFHEWKWRNIIMSLAHSAISGLTACYLSMNADWSGLSISSIGEKSSSRHLLCISIGYFIYDSVLSISRLSIYPGRIEIIVHHVITMVTLGLALFDWPILIQLMPYCVFGLIVELSNVFIHIRSLMELENIGSNRSLYKLNSCLTLVSILICRFWPLERISADLRTVFAARSILLQFTIHLPVISIGLISCVIFWRIAKEDLISRKEMDVSGKKSLE